MHPTQANLIYTLQVPDLPTLTPQRNNPKPAPGWAMREKGEKLGQWPGEEGKISDLPGSPFIPVSGFSLTQPGHPRC